MNFLGPTRHRRINEACAFVFLIAGFFLFLSLASYHPLDPSWNTATGGIRPVNLTGRVGAFFSDLMLQGLGLAAYLLPVLTLLLGWKWVRSSLIDTPWARIIGGFLSLLSACTALGLIPDWHPIAGVVPAGGLIGTLMAGFLMRTMNVTGAVLTTLGACVLSVYLISSFEVARLPVWFRVPLAWIGTAYNALFKGRLTGWLERFRDWREERAQQARERAAERAERSALRRKAEQIMSGQAAEGVDAAAAAAAARADGFEMVHMETSGMETSGPEPAIVDPLSETHPARRRRTAELPPDLDAIPIRELEEEEVHEPQMVGLRVDPPGGARYEDDADLKRTEFDLPPLDLLQEPEGRTPWDSDELKQTAADIKSKFEEFNVRGHIAQINPGPVVTTFEFKPEAGVKYSRITTLTEDLCLGLQAESILIERIPGKPTVGIEVPNTKREVISLRQILESEEFTGSPSPLTVALGKDINGRIKVATLDTMPHLLIAGSTGSGKSVMLNSLIMSILYKATPNEVRLIMVDPKRLEFGLYEGIPHLLTPVITDAKKATYALRNAVLEMERRLKLLASAGVRNIDQFNKKVRKLQNQPRLFNELPDEDALEPIPYILVLIDELADLMMLERANVEESVTRLAQMARAVGMHLVLATQRPSVDVITGLIKANFPSRISFRVATRVDSRTVLDVMGAEHLLGKGDMLYLPPGSSRLVRVHGSYVSEAETNDVVEYWKRQAEPEYDKSFLVAPINEEEEGGEVEQEEDAMYQDAVRIVCEMGKASTSTLQRRLRLGYGRAARILDMMQRDGIIGPPDGSRPREVLKTPDWLHEVEDQLR